MNMDMNGRELGRIDSISIDMMEFDCGNGTFGIGMENGTGIRMENWNWNQNGKLELEGRQRATRHYMISWIATGSIRFARTITDGGVEKHKNV